MRKRVKNSPTIQEVIREFLGSKSEPVSVEEIYQHVAHRVTLKSKNPRASVFSVLTKMPDAERVTRGMYIRSTSRRNSNV